MRHAKGAARPPRVPAAPPAARLGARCHFTNVPTAQRARVLAALKARPEFREGWTVAPRGAGVALTLRLPEPMAFTHDGYRFTAFAWMGEIYVWGQEESPPNRSELARA